MVSKRKNIQTVLAQSAGAAEYTDCISVKGKDTPNECPQYDSKQFDGEVPVMLELWEMWSTPLLPSLTGPHWTRVVAPNRVLSMSQIELLYLFVVEIIEESTNFDSMMFYFGARKSGL